MDRKEKDRHLDVSGEANRDKHINFIAEEKMKKIRLMNLRQVQCQVTRSIKK
jgi:hypothetical protein